MDKNVLNKEKGAEINKKKLLKKIKYVLNFVNRTYK